MGARSNINKETSGESKGAIGWSLGDLLSSVLGILSLSVSLPPLRIVPGGEQIISSGMSLVCSRGFHQNLIRESLINLPFLFFASLGIYFFFL